MIAEAAKHAGPGDVVVCPHAVYAQDGRAGVRFRGSPQRTHQGLGACPRAGRVLEQGAGLSQKFRELLRQRVTDEAAKNIAHHERTDPSILRAALTSPGRH